MPCNMSCGFISNFHLNDHDQSHTAKCSILSYFCFSVISVFQDSLHWLPYRQSFHMENHHFQLKFEWTLSQNHLIFDIVPARSQLGFNLVNKTCFSNKEFKFERKVYKDDIQKSFWSWLQNCVIKTFVLMEYKMQPGLGKEKLEFPKTNEAMIDQVISRVEVSTTEELKKLVAYITLGHIA